MGENAVQGTTAGNQGSPVPQRSPADMEAQRNKMMQMMAQAGSRGQMAGAPADGAKPPPGNGMMGMMGGAPGGGAGGVPPNKGAGMGGPGGRTTNMLMGLKQRPMANPAAGISPPGAGLVAPGGM